MVGAGHRLGGGVGDVRQASCTKLTSYVRSFLTACGHRHTHVSNMCRGSLQKPSFKRDTRFLLLFPPLPITSDFLVSVIACRIKFDVMTLHCLVPSLHNHVAGISVWQSYCTAGVDPNDEYLCTLQLTPCPGTTRKALRSHGGIVHLSPVSIFPFGAYFSHNGYYG